MSSRRRRKAPRTRRIDGAEAQQRQAAEASAAFWHGTAPAPPSQAVPAEPHKSASENEQPAEPDSATARAAGVPAAAGRAAADADILTARRRVAVTPDPTATVRSLGKPPLAGRETVAEHYFEAVYQRSVAMAGALAAAGGLLEDDSDSS